MFSSQVKEASPFKLFTTYSHLRLVAQDPIVFSHLFFFLKIQPTQVFLVNHTQVVRLNVTFFMSMSTFIYVTNMYKKIVQMFSFFEFVEYK